MDLQQQWNSLNGEITAQDPGFESGTALRNNSKAVYETLLQKLKYKRNWITFFALALLACLTFADGLTRYILLGWFLVYAIGALEASKQVATLPPHIDYSTITRELIIRQLTVVRNVLAAESKFLYFFGPFIAPSGFLVGLLLKHKTFAQVKQHFPYIWALLITGTLAFFLMKWLGDKMTRFAFEGDIKKMEANLQELDL